MKRTPPRETLNTQHSTLNSLLLAAIFSAACLWLYQRPVWHTDIWGHLAYGRWIVEHGELPATEPLMPLSRGVPFVDSAWLSQLIALGLFRGLGVAGLKLLYATAISATGVTLAALTLVQTRRIWAALGALLCFALLNIDPLMIVRPQLLGLVCFALLLYLVFTHMRRRRSGLWIAAIFALWANLHGSFVVGLLVLAALTAGRGWDVWRKTRRLRPAISETWLRRYATWTVAAAAAACLNPYGPALYLEVVGFARNANVLDLIEWRAMSLHMSLARVFFAFALGLLAVVLMSPRRIRGVEILLLCGLGVLALRHSRMLIWWSLPAAYCLAVHCAACFARRAPRPRLRRVSFSVVAAVLTTVGVVSGPVMDHWESEGLSSTDRMRRATSWLTPVDAVAALPRMMPRGQMYNTYEWGDYLLWAGPENVQVFVASHAQLVPADVWRDYLSISKAEPGWHARLDHYQVQLVLIDKRGRRDLIAALREHPEWELSYEDRIAAMFVRQGADEADETTERPMSSDPR